MTALFDTLFGWFNALYSTYLDTFMLDVVDNNGNLLLSDGYIVIGWIDIVLSLLVAFSFYIWPLDHPKFKSWWSWLIMAAGNGALNFIVTICYTNYRIGNATQDVIQQVTGVSDGTLDNCISIGDILGLAFANVLVSFIFFIVASAILTWFGNATKYSPLKK